MKFPSPITYSGELYVVELLWWVMGVKWLILRLFYDMGYITCYEDDEINKNGDEMDGACITYEDDEKSIQILSEIPDGKRLSEDLVVDGG